MTRPIIVLYTHARDYSGLVTLGSAVHVAMSGNAYFLSPVPDMLSLRAVVNETSAAIAAWGPVGNRGSHLDNVKLRAKATELLLMLRSLSQYVTSQAIILAGT